MPKVNTGFQAPDYAAMDAQTAPTDGSPRKPKTKTVYPDITLRGDAADALIGAHKLGEEVDADIVFKIVRLKQSQGATQSYGSPVSPGEASETTVELEIMSINSEDSEQPPGDGEESAEDAVDNYRANQGAPAEED